MDEKYDHNYVIAFVLSVLYIYVITRAFAFAIAIARQVALTVLSSFFRWREVSKCTTMDTDIDNHYNIKSILKPHFQNKDHARPPCIESNSSAVMWGRVKITFELI